MKIVLLMMFGLIGFAQVPDIQLSQLHWKTEESTIISLKKLSDEKWVLLDFWAPWCGPCKKSFPAYNQLKKKYPKVHILAITMEDSLKDVWPFLKKYQPQFEVFYDEKAQLASLYNIKGMPTVVLINPQGKVVLSVVGFTQKKEKQIENALKGIR